MGVDMDEKFENILRKTGEMFLKFGIRSVSMDDICRELGISKKTLYQYVENKKELIKNTLEFSLKGKFDNMLKVDDEDINAPYGNLFDTFIVELYLWRTELDV